MQLHLKKFDITSIADDKVIILLGKRDTGKSFLVGNLLYHHRDIPVGVVISPTEAMNRFYSDIVPSLFIHDTFKPEIVDNVLRRQKLIIKKKRKEEERTGHSRIDPRAFFILDDCMADNSWIRDKNAIACFTNGRHYKLLFMVTQQFPLGIPPLLRTNIDYVFILRENLISNRRRIYENYAGMFPNFEVFCQVMDQCTENYECLVIHNNAKSNRIEDQVFWYKADRVPPFKLGAKEFWTLGQELAAQEDDDDGDEELYDPSQIKMKRGPSVNVKKNY
jgi:hypothetical protein